MAVAAKQRFTRQRPCPVCGGFDQASRGQGIRCFGFLSLDSQWAHCAREEHAGHLVINQASQTYPHLLSGDCRCGKEHSSGSHVPSSPPGNNGRRIVDTYDYEDQDGNQFQVVRYSPKGFSQRRPGENSEWVYNLQGVRRSLPLYRPKELLAAGKGVTVYPPEGEKDLDRLRDLGLVATTTIIGAGSARHSDLTPP